MSLIVNIFPLKCYCAVCLRGPYIEYHKDQYWDLYFFLSMLMIFQNP